MQRMIGLSWRTLFAAALLAGLLRVPASAQEYGIDEISLSGAWSKTRVISTTNVYPAIAMDWRSPAPVMYIALPGGNAERWKYDPPWNKDPAAGIVTDGTLYNDLVAHVEAPNQLYGADTAGGVDLIRFIVAWENFSIFGSGTTYNSVAMDRVATPTPILYAAPAAGNVERWQFIVNWHIMPPGGIVTDGTVYNDLVGDRTADNSLYGVSTNGGIDRIFYNDSFWDREVNVVGTSIIYTSIAAENDTNNPTLYAGLASGGVHRWESTNGVDWVSTIVLPGDCAYTSLVGSTVTKDQFFGTAADGPGPPTGMGLLVR